MQHLRRAPRPSLRCAIRLRLRQKPEIFHFDPNLLIRGNLNFRDFVPISEIQSEKLHPQRPLPHGPLHNSVWSSFIWPPLRLHDLRDGNPMLHREPGDIYSQETPGDYLS